MHTTHLRKVGGSVMLAVPPTLLDLLNLAAGARVGISVQDHRLVIEPDQRPRYTLEELLAACNANAPRDAEDEEWLAAAPIGTEIL